MSSTIGRVLLTLGALSIVAGVLAPGADADRNGKVLLSVNGAAFSADPQTPLFDTTALAPGRGVSALLGVRSGFGVGTVPAVRLVDVADDDNGCGPTESEVDTGCGPGQGELGAATAITIEWSTGPGGVFHRAWQGAADRLAARTQLPVHLPARGERLLRVSATVPASVGNEIQSDTLTFGVRVELSGPGASGHAVVDGTSAAGRGDYGGPPTSSGLGALAGTGVSTALFVAGGVLLLTAGGMLVLAALRRPSATWVGSSRGRRAPRPTAVRSALRGRDRAR